MSIFFFVIYLAHSALREIKKVEVSRREEWEERQELEAQRQRWREEKYKKAAEWQSAQQDMQELRRQKEKIAPSPPPPLHVARHPSGKHEYYNTYGAELGYLHEDITMKAFLDDEYADKLIRSYYIDFDEFKDEYYHFIVDADSLWKCVNAQLRTMVFNPYDIMHRLSQALDYPPSQETAYDIHSYHFMKHYIRRWREEWKLIESGKKWGSLKPMESLWVYFKTWFLDHRLGPVLCARAALIETEFDFEREAAKDGGIYRSPHYGCRYPEQIERALTTLHEWDQARKCNKAKNRNDDGLKKEKKSAANHGDDNAFKANDEQNNGDASSSSDDDNNVIDEMKQELTKTAGIDVNREREIVATYNRLKEERAKEKRAGPNYFELEEQYEYSPEDDDCDQDRYDE